MKNKWKFLPLLLVGLMLLGGCGSQSGEKAQSGKKTIVAATEGTMKGIAYMDKDNKLTGYEVEVLKAAAAKAGYDIQFQTTEFASIFAGIDSGRYQIGFGSISKTPIREKKYSFTKVTHYYEPAVFAFPKGFLQKHPVNHVEDLGGLRTYLNPTKGNAWQQYVEAFNAKYPDKPIQVTYSDEGWAAYYRRLNSDDGIDVLKTNETRLYMLSKEYGYQFDFVVLPQAEMDKVGKLTNPNTYFVFPKTEEGAKMAADFDKAIAELQKDGTLSKLSKEFLGNDYSSQENYEKAHTKK